MKAHQVAWGLVAIAVVTIGARTLYRVTVVDPATVTTAIDANDSSAELCPGIPKRSAQLATGDNTPSIEVFQSNVQSVTGWKVEKPLLPSVDPGEYRAYRCELSGPSKLTFEVFVNERETDLPRFTTEPAPLSLGIPGTGFSVVGERSAFDTVMLAQWTCGNRRMLAGVELREGRDQMADVTTLLKRKVKYLQCEGPGATE
jgi:hypothetical protein